MKDSEDTLGQIALTFETMKSSKVPIPPLPGGRGRGEPRGGVLEKGYGWTEKTQLVQYLDWLSTRRGFSISNFNYPEIAACTQIPGGVGKGVGLLAAQRQEVGVEGAAGTKGAERREYL